MAKQYFSPDDWLVSEDPYTPALHALHETIFALGNGYMGVRGTPEEGFSGGRCSRGTYLPLVYDEGSINYEWRRGNFPTRSTFVVTSPDWVPITLTLNGIPFDPLTGTVREYRRVLNLREGTLTRRLVWEDAEGRQTEIESIRIASAHQPHLGAIRYSFRPLNYRGEATVTCALDGQPATNCVPMSVEALGEDGALLCVETAKMHIQVAEAMRTQITAHGVKVPVTSTFVGGEKCAAQTATFAIEAGTMYTVEKYVGICTSRDQGDAGDARQRAMAIAAQACATGFTPLLADHVEAWAAVWEAQDVEIDGDPAAQQGIRFSIFHLHWNYAGTDPRLNVGAKGISGPGYGGLYFWDSEVYLLPYYAYTSPAKARNLLMQRYITLSQAKARARSFGWQGAFYPWTTLDGTDCAIPWEYGMLEQHVSVAIPYGVWLYHQVSGDEEFIWQYGAEMVLETCRFWASRVLFSERRQKYVINTVTGPDEYAMVVNNNCYTNTMAKFVLEYGLELIQRMQAEQPAAWQMLAERLGFAAAEPARWQDIAKRMYLPFDRALGLHPQDDSFLDMDPVDVAAIPEEEKPLLGHWPWERIIRSQVLKQPDVLLLMFLLNDRYSGQVKRANYQYYEPKTIHDSSLSPCIHNILAAELGYEAQAFDYYLRTARLDLDDVNGNADQGVHIANMAGSWMSIVNGFAGMRLHKGRLTFTPHLPTQWSRLAFQVRFHGRTLHVTLTPEAVAFTLRGRPLTVTVQGMRVRLSASAPVTVALPLTAAR